MKKTNFTLFLVSLIILTSCTRNSIKEPEQIGKQVFEILKNLSIKSKVDYVSNFLSIDEMRELAKNEQIVKTERKRNEMTLTSKKQWVGSKEIHYNKIKEIGEEYGINWQEIEYLDFIYKIETDEVFKGLKGHLFFKYNDKEFQFEVNSIFNGTEYKLLKIRSLMVYD